MGLMIAKKTNFVPKIAIESQENSRSTSHMCCCTSESNRSLCVVFGNPSGFNARMGLVIAWKVCEVMTKNIMNRKFRLNLKGIQEVQVKRVVAQVSQTVRFAMYLGIRVDLMLKWDS
ncbi:uncharacterized protein G2W53_033442 [Senna tora]|uniref:Uncharacterized protein n=1 Tax=Senna tora TaxID=362788 RepID=A0A834WAZ7_9FABA|nr:uncharacterized protein G2W53_033442 [Senna tora]